MRGPFIQSDEIDHSIKNSEKKICTLMRKEKSSAKKHKHIFLSSDEDLKILKDKAACYGRDLDPVPIDGDCFITCSEKTV